MGLFSKLFDKKDNKTVRKERDPLSIEIGDIIVYDLIDYEVVGKITYRQDAYEWISYQLLEGKNIIWLAAEMDDKLELGIYRTITLPVKNNFPNQLDYDGKAYHLEERGEARVVGEGRSRNINGKTIFYAEYNDDEETSFISLEDWGNEVEASIGYEIEAYELKIIAGS